MNPITYFSPEARRLREYRRGYSAAAALLLDNPESRDGLQAEADGAQFMIDDYDRGYNDALARHRRLYP